MLDFFEALGGFLGLKVALSIPPELAHSIANRVAAHLRFSKRAVHHPGSARLKATANAFGVLPGERAFLTAPNRPRTQQFHRPSIHE